MQNQFRIVVGLVALSLISCFSGRAEDTLPNRVPAGELLRRVVNAELNAEASYHTHWTYVVNERQQGSEKVKLVIQTPAGEIDRLCLVNGRPVSTEQQRAEDKRIEALVHDPEQQRKKKRAQEEDNRRTERLFRMLPDAVIATYGNQKGDLVEILFAPNPNFHPSSHEAAVFHALEGRIWVNKAQARLVEIQGRLVNTVKFGGGLLGYLDKGGEFQVEQSEVATGHWEVTLMHIDMHGKALCFKTIGVQENETRSNFQRMEDNLTLAQAAAKLQKESAASDLAAFRSRSNKSASAMSFRPAPH